MVHAARAGHGARARILRAMTARRAAAVIALVTAAIVLAAAIATRGRGRAADSAGRETIAVVRRADPHGGRMTGGDLGYLFHGARRLD